MLEWVVSQAWLPSGTDVHFRENGRPCPRSRSREGLPRPGGRGGGRDAGLAVGGGRGAILRYEVERRSPRACSTQPRAQGGSPPLVIGEPSSSRLPLPRHTRTAAPVSYRQGSLSLGIATRAVLLVVHP